MKNLCGVFFGLVCKWNRIGVLFLSELQLFDLSR